MLHNLLEALKAYYMKYFGGMPGNRLEVNAAG
jgi:hypothetical protein